MHNPDLLNFIIPGITFGFAAAAQPGPLAIYLVSRTLQSGWKKTLPAIFAPLLTDGPIAVLCLLVLGSVPSGFLHYIRIAGGIFILYLAFQSFRTWRMGAKHIPLPETSSAKTLRDATLVNFLNPGPYLGWSLIIGPIFLEGWKMNQINGVAAVLCFYLSMFFVSGLIIFLFDKARERGEKIQNILLGMAALALAIFGSYQLVKGLIQMIIK